MKWYALTNQPGAYELRQAAGEVLGGLLIDAQNRGVGFIGDATDNRYTFVFEDGLINKKVAVFVGTATEPIAAITLGFIDNGTLTIGAETYSWQSLSSSKLWQDHEKCAVLLLDLEGDVSTPRAVLCAESLAPTRRALLILSGFYLTVIEYRAGFSNSNLAGSPVKTETGVNTNQTTSTGEVVADWVSLLLDVASD